MKQNYTIRKMTRKEVDLALDWAAAEGWNPGLCDADCFYATDPEGFLVGLLDGEPVGSISAISYGEAFGFLGFYIVRPEFRGRGLGIRLWNAGMDRLGGRNVGLDGVVEQQENYKKSGFCLSYRNIRYQGLAGESGTVGGEGDGAIDHGIVELSEVPFEDVCAYDDALFLAPRHRFLRSWIDQPGSAALGILEGGRLAGYGVIRACREGFKIGPLFADDWKLAEALFQALESRAEDGVPVFLDTPETNPAAVALAKRCGMEKVFETARMYTGKDPGLSVDRIFGVTTFELG